MPEQTIHILHLFPDLLNLYGDKGNLAALCKRLTWRGIEATVTTVTQDSKELSLDDVDIVFLGGGSDREQMTVAERLMPYKQALKDYVEQGGVLLGFCGGFELLGTSWWAGDIQTDGLGILDIHAERGEQRFIGDVVLSSDWTEQPICGFENHPGRMQIGDYQPLGKVIAGHGNDGVSALEGVLYKNVFATYLHGPLLPKNPELCDSILTRALTKKYPDFAELSPLDDTLELAANRFIVQNFSGNEK
ncbi:MAG: glutamine amidotransferase [Clostridia bacterium]|nr:glutamine amidotransferase [Clostridia bacterium]